MTVSVPLNSPSPLNTLAPLEADSLTIARFSALGTGEWPDRLAATICLQGCPWECTHCHDPALQHTDVAGGIAWSTVMTALRRKRLVVDSVVFTGGEPTRQAGLADAIAEVSELGYRVGLRTAGAYPGRLAAVLPLVDWVGIDIKSTAARYDAVTGQGVSGSRAWESLALIRDCGIDYEVRMTVDPTVHSRQDVLDTVRDIIRSGAHAPVLHQARAVPGSAFAKALRGRGLYDVIRLDDLPDLERR